MKLGNILKSKKFKNICVTLVEILVVAAVIMGILMTIQSNLKTNTGTGTGNGGTEQEASEKEKDEAGDEYYLEVNKKKNVMIVYQYNKDKSDKKAIKVVSASVGKKVKENKYKIKETYTWRNTDETSWNKYNTRYSDSGWIQSVDYKDKYSWTLNKKSYEALGKSQSDDSNIKLSAKDAQWVFSKCKEGTVVKVVKGKKDDKLPMETEELIKLRKYCLWDPTDPEKGNPYKNVANEAISLYEGTVYVEKGSDINYTANIIALDKDGKNVTNKLKYTKIDTSVTGSHKVKYSYKIKGGKTLKGTVKYNIIDTTVPRVSISQSRFTYEVASSGKKDLNTDAVKKAIENLVRSHASASEGSIKVTALPKGELVIGDNHVRVVATDSAGNVGSAEAVVEIKVKVKKPEQNSKPTKKEEETTKKKKKKDKNSKKDNKKEETTDKGDEETTVAQESENTSEDETEITEE